jgi:hypothetical protein
MKEKKKIEYIKDIYDKNYIQKLKFDLDLAIKKGNLVQAQNITNELVEISRLKK